MIESLCIVATLLGVPHPMSGVLALRYQVADERDIKYLTAGDIAARMRIACPRIEEARDLPPKDAILDGLIFNRAHARWLEARMTENTAFGPWQRQNQSLYDFWESARMARQDYIYLWPKRLELRKCRELIGPQDWFFRNFPPYVPIWYFREVLP